MTKNYYATLQIATTASTGEIKRAYKDMALLVHPDKNPSPNATAEFQVIQDAYETLIDATKRARYDAGLKNASNTPNAYSTVPVSQEQSATFRVPTDFHCTRLHIQLSYMRSHNLCMSRWTNAVEYWLSLWGNVVYAGTGEPLRSAVMRVNIQFEREDYNTRKTAIDTIITRLEGEKHDRGRCPPGHSYGSIARYTELIAQWQHILEVKPPQVLYVSSPNEMSLLRQVPCRTIYSHIIPTGNKQRKASGFACKRCGRVASHNVWAFVCTACSLGFCKKCTDELRMLKAYLDWLGRLDHNGGGGPLDANLSM